MKDIKYAVVLLLTNMSLTFVILGLSKMVQQTVTIAESDNYVNKMIVENQNLSINSETEREILKSAASGQRVISYSSIEADDAISEEEYQTLLQIVEAEAGGEDLTGKELVANVVLNRVESEAFPDNVIDVVYQKANGVTQFQPVSDGKIKQVKVSEEAKEAVDLALLGTDNSEGALYFVSRQSANPERMKWFDEHLTFLFTHGGHEFFK